MDVTLRERRDEDLPILFAFQADPEASAMAAFPSRDEAAFAAHHAKLRSDPTVLERTVVSDGEVVGSIGSWQGEEGRLLAYWIGRPYWGLGIATTAVAVFLEEETARPLSAKVAEHNLGSVLRIGVVALGHVPYSPDCPGVCH